MHQFEFMCVDYQYDFAGENGKVRVVGNSPQFIDSVLFPYFRANQIKVHEIISDYRLPRGRSKSESCVPGTLGFMSLLPDELRYGKPHIKCMHNPIWTRKGIGVENSVLGSEYQDPDLFSKWISVHLPDKDKSVILFGETMDCCILNVAQELYYRGYTVLVLYEGTDPMAERQEHKDLIAYDSCLCIYAKVIRFNELVAMLDKV